MKVIFLFLASILIVPNLAFAWGQEGHSAVAEIAQRNLSTAARKSIDDLLGSGVSLASVSSWADDVRDQRPSSYNWHFVDIPITSPTYDASRDCKPEVKGDCIIAELERLKTDIQCGETIEKKREAIKWATHFIGDIHQPMHTVLDGRGANDFRVSITAKGITGKSVCTSGCPLSNLHKLWDGDIINKLVWSWGALLESTQEKKFQLPESDPLDPVIWANSTHKIAIDMWNLALAKKDPSNSDTYIIDDDYINAARPVIEQQISWAGQRLARFFNAT